MVFPAIPALGICTPRRSDFSSSAKIASLSRAPRWSRRMPRLRPAPPILISEGGHGRTVRARRNTAMNRFSKQFVSASNSMPFGANGGARVSSLGLAERELASLFSGMEERILHHCDRPDGEVRILAFIAQAQGPTTDGIAKEIGISLAAAEFHLRELRRANRVWGQPVKGNTTSWYVSQEGRRFLAQRGNRVARETESTRP